MEIPSRLPGTAAHRHQCVTNLRSLHTSVHVTWPWITTPFIPDFILPLYLQSHGYPRRLTSGHEPTYPRSIILRNYTRPYLY